VWHVKPTFWLPGYGLAEKARKDRVPYDLWERQGHLIAAPGKSIDYEFVAAHLRHVFDPTTSRRSPSTAGTWRHLKPWLERRGFRRGRIEAQVRGIRPGLQSMSPALRDLEAELLNGRVAHGGHPVLTMCAANAVVQPDPAGNRKLTKAKSAGRIDGMVALTMAMGVAPLSARA
jgi:phage terminase large subunit-like protein